MKTISLLIILSIALLAGCATQGGYQNMTAEQIAALAKMKDANVNCTKGSTPLIGQFFTVFVNLDKDVIPAGGISVNGDCTINITNTQSQTTVTTVTTPLAPLAPVPQARPMTLQIERVR